MSLHASPRASTPALTWVQVRRAFAVAMLLSAAGQAADIQGTIVVERKLTKRNVTPAAGLYQRVVAVEVGADVEQDPLAYERSHVVIYLEGQPDSRRGPASRSPSASIEQRDRRFVPDIVTIPANSVISFPNFDPVFHNVFSLSKPKNFDLGNYAKGQTRLVTFSRPGVVLVYCHLHPNMAAAIVVTPNQFAAIADASGKFTLHDVPPGKYTVVAWHKTAGIFRQTIEVTENGASGVRFLVPLPAEPLPPESTSHADRDHPTGAVANR
ncbi:MAG: hypothetical protein ABI824_00020 [Acidobacteriota bacterium]